MSLASTGITVSTVKTTLGTSSNNLSSLCTNENINPWSVWKPISAKVTTLDRATIKDKNYGITVIQGNTAAQLATNIRNNSGIGFIYNKPTGTDISPYRLGDFRNYNHTAINPQDSHFKDNDVVKIGNVSESFEELLTGLKPEHPENADNTFLDSTDYVGMYHILPYMDNNGNRYTWNHGVYLTDGTTSLWSVSKIPWGNSHWQKLKGKTVTAYEFYTNIANGTNSSNYTTQDTDRFYAIPYPMHTITCSTATPSGSKLCFITGTFSALDSTYSRVTYSFKFSSIGDIYAGGSIKNIYIGIYKDADCTQAINYVTKSEFTLGSEEESSLYTGTLANSTGERCYVGIFFNNKLQYSTIPLVGGGFAT